MARTPNTVRISLHILMRLLNYRWSAVKTPTIGELGDVLHEDFVNEIDKQSKVEIRPSQLADLVYHMREAVFDGAPTRVIDLTPKNHNVFMHELRREYPELFKQVPSGEIVMVNIENRDDC